MENLLLKTPYKFKKSYGGTLEPQTTQDAPWLHGPSLKIHRMYSIQPRHRCLASAANKGLLRLPAGGFTAAERVTGVSLDRFSERHLSRF
jgi:hypothetical protein